MKLLFAYNCWSDSIKESRERIVKFAYKTGLDITLFCLTPGSPRPRYSWTELDRLWRRRYPPLTRMFNKLKELAENADVLWVYNGGNFHPDWLKRLSPELLTVFGCFDDPESSDNLSLPVARFFDACLVGNIAAIPQYQGWGCRNVEWGPIFLDTEAPQFNRTELAAGNRPVDLIFFGERESEWRKERLSYLAEQFPSAHFLGRGWPGGYVSRDILIQSYKSAKIGINIHNSTGPINKRLFELPAYGIMQICDNKCRLGQIFDLNREAVGFDNITEAVDLIHHYLNNEEEREAIAWHGYKRYQNEYAPVQLWERYAKILRNWKEQKTKGTLEAPAEYNFETSVVMLNKKVKNTLKRVRSAFRNTLSPQKNVKAGYNYFQTAVGKHHNLPYIENPEAGPRNMSTKDRRVNEGGFFEWPNMVALNWTIASMVGNAKRIVEIGSGTGCFAYEAAADPSRMLFCLEADERARKWAIANRSRPNIKYTNFDLKDIKEPFDLLVTIDVVEHIKDYKTFLEHCQRIAERAIITTPNRFRNNGSNLRPAYLNHVREWSAGEFYWVLRTFWSKVELYTRPDPYVPLSISASINTKMLDLIAVCSNE